MKYLFAFAQGILIEGKHRQGEIRAIPHSFNIIAPDLQTYVMQADTLIYPIYHDGYYIQFTVNWLDTRPPPDHPATTALGKLAVIRHWTDARYARRKSQIVSALVVDTLYALIV